MKRQGKENIKKRRKSFFAVLAAMLMVINLLPMNAFAASYILGDNITVNSNQLIRPGDKVQFASSGNVVIDGGTPVYMSDGEWYENAVGSGKYYIGTKESGANNLLLSSVYKVSFDTDGGSAAPADQYIAKNSLVTEPAADPTKDNFTFDKWMLSGQDGEGNPTYSDWDFATDTVQNTTTFVAKWLSNYTVAYDSNGGTGTMDNQARTYDDGTALTANAFTRSNYIFSGWNTAADGSGTAYADGATANLSSTNGATVTLYAQWTADWTDAVPRQNATEGYNNIPGTLIAKGYTTEQSIQNALYRAIVDDNPGFAEDANVTVGTTLFDVKFQVSFDGGNTYVNVTPENFPAEGLVVTIPYPEGTNKDNFNFEVSHMFEENVNGHTAGDIEKPAVTKTDTGIQFRVMGLSPILVAWTSIPAPEPEPEPEPQPVLEVRAPKTGDRANIATYMIMTSLIAGIALTAYGAAQKRRKR